MSLIQRRFFQIGARMQLVQEKTWGSNITHSLIVKIVSQNLRNSAKIFTSFNNDFSNFYEHSLNLILKLANGRLDPWIKK